LSGCERPTCTSYVAQFFKLRRNSAKRKAILPVSVAEALCLPHELRIYFPIALATLDALPLLNGLAITGRPKFLHQSLFFYLSKNSHDRHHALGHLIGVFRQVLPIGCREKPHAPLSQQSDAEHVRFHLASEATHVFNEDGSHAIVLDPIQQGSEAGAVFDRICSANGGINQGNQIVRIWRRSAARVFVRLCLTGYSGKSRLVLAFLTVRGGRSFHEG
jgi:hypothetical protein